LVPLAFFSFSSFFSAAVALAFFFAGAAFVFVTRPDAAGARGFDVFAPDFLEDFLDVEGAVVEAVVVDESGRTRWIELH
jgi:hypothetical protein